MSYKYDNAYLLLDQKMIILITKRSCFELALTVHALSACTSVKTITFRLVTNPNSAVLVQWRCIPFFCIHSGRTIYGPSLSCFGLKNFFCFFISSLRDGIHWNGILVVFALFFVTLSINRTLRNSDQWWCRRIDIRSKSLQTILRCSNLTI